MALELVAIPLAATSSSFLFLDRGEARMANMRCLRVVLKLFATILTPIPLA
jgi:hypothetical protein